MILQRCLSADAAVACSLVLSYSSVTRPGPPHFGLFNIESIITSSSSSLSSFSAITFHRMGIAIIRRIESITANLTSAICHHGKDDKDDLAPTPPHRLPAEPSRSKPLRRHKISSRLKLLRFIIIFSEKFGFETPPFPFFPFLSSSLRAFFIIINHWPAPAPRRRQTP